MSDPKRLLEEGSAFERTLLEAAKEDAPSEEAKARARAILGLGPIVGGPGAGPSSLPPDAGLGASAASTGVLSASAKWVVGASLAAVLGTGGLLLSVAPEPERAAPRAAVRAEPSSPVQTPPLELLPAEVPLPTEKRREEPEAPRPSATAQERKTRPATETRSASDLAHEIELIDGARKAKERGDYEGARAQLRRYRSEIVDGSLDQEAEVVAIETELAAGRGDEARKLGEAFLARYPTSPLGNKVRSLLEGR